MRVAATLALVLLGCACSDGSPTGPSYNAFAISGRVIDYRTQAAVAGAVVRFSHRQFGDREATTDARGTYSATLPVFDFYNVTVDGVVPGGASVWTTEYRGDFIIGTTGCHGRYGVVMDTRTHQPVPGATVSFAGGAATGPDGWYYADGGCPVVTLPGGTSFMSVTHPRYETAVIGTGRGLGGFSRQDVRLDPKPD